MLTQTVMSTWRSAKNLELSKSYGQQRSNVVGYFLVNIENEKGEWYNDDRSNWSV